MSIHAPFQGIDGGNQLVSTGAGSASVSINGSSQSVRLVNSGTTNPCHVRIGAGAQTAAATDLVVRANSEIVVRKADGDNVAAYIQSGGATTLYIQPGEGGI